MSIAFDTDRWCRIKKDYNEFFQKKRSSAVTGVAIASRNPGRIEPETPYLSQENCNNFAYTPEMIIDSIEYNLSRFEFYGSAFPMVNFDAFGPGIVAGFLGAGLDNSTGRVWFHPSKEYGDLSEIDFSYDSENIWLKRIKDIYKEGIKRFEGKVLLGMPDLGGILDILAVFRGSENLLYDLYDSPEQVKRLTARLTSLWHQFYDELNAILGTGNPGCTNWSTIYTENPSYIVQSDFSYMISTEMFKEFAFGELNYTFDRLKNSTYHLDGAGQLGHLDLLLSIDSLACVQWIPGEGNAPYEDWKDVYLKIRDKGKLIQVGWTGFESLSKICGYVENSGLIQTPPKYFEEKDSDYALSWLKKLNIEK